MSLPRGITYRYIVKLFMDGYSIKGVALALKCEEWEVQLAIRRVLNRQKAYR